MGSRSISGLAWALLGVGLIVPRAAPAAINLVLNGSFEQTAFAVPDNGFQVFFPAGNANPFQILNWQSVLPTQNIEIQRNFAVGISAFGGLQWLEMDDAANVVDQNHLFQDISTEAGQLYELSFRYRGRPGAPPAANTLGVRWGGADLGTLTQPIANASDPWLLFSTLVTASSSSTRLQFEDRGPADPGFGMLVDDVQLVAAPEPSSLILLAGSGAIWLGLAARRRLTRRQELVSKFAPGRSC
jgi:hypothetical protein